MMHEFKDFQPAEWQEDGLVHVTPPKQPPKASRARRSPWPILVLGMTFGAGVPAQLAFSFNGVPSGAVVSCSTEPVSEAFLSEGLDDPDTVHPSYWSGVRAYMAAVPRVAEDNSVADPDPII
jgi:hypothetical protein